MYSNLTQVNRYYLQSTVHKNLCSKESINMKNKMNLLTKMWNISTSKRDGVSSPLKFGRRTTKQRSYTFIQHFIQIKQLHI